MSFSIQRRGRLGEREFSAWADKARMTVSSPDVDEKGWDRYLEWRLTEEEYTGPSVSLDKENREVKALVQIKTTKSRKGAWSLRLPNWRNLVQHQGPSFLAVLEVNEGKMDIEVENAYLLHIWEEQIAAYKKRLVERERGDKPLEELTPFHKATLRTSYDDGVLLDEPYPQSLRAALSDPVSDSPDDYTAIKRELRDRVGYPDGYKQAKLRVTTEVPEKYRDDPTEHLADVLMGQAKFQDPTIEMADVRFGHQSDFRGTPPDAEIRLGVEKEKARLRFKRESGFKRRSIDAHLQATRIGVEPQSGKTKSKILFSYPRIEGEARSHGAISLSRVGKSTTSRFNFNLHAQAQLPLKKLYRCYRVLSYVEETLAAEKVLVIEGKKEGEEWSTLMKLDGAEDSARGILADLQKGNVSHVHILLDAAYRLVQETEAPTNTPVKLMELVEAQELLHLVRESLAPGNEGATLTMNLTMKGEMQLGKVGKELPKGPVGLAGIGWLDLGGHIITIPFALSGRMIKVCKAPSSEDAKDEGKTYVDTPQAHETLQSLSLGEVAYRFDVDDIDYLKPYSFESNNEVPPENELIKRPISIMEERHDARFLLTERGLLASFAD